MSCSSGDVVGYRLCCAAGKAWRRLEDPRPERRAPPSNFAALRLVMQREPEASIPSAPLPGLSYIRKGRAERILELAR